MDTKKQKEPQKQKKQAEELPKLTPAKAKALELIKREPNAPLIEIGRKLKDLGMVTKPERIYELTRNDRTSGYMGREIDEIRRKNLEKMSGEIVPEALKIHKRVLKNKKIPDEKKKDWVAMAEKAEFQIDETKRPIVPANINFTEVRAIINKIINTDVEPGYFKNLTPSGEHDKD